MHDQRTLDARQQAVDQAASIGINETFINNLVEEFYHRIRKHQTLGPVFDSAISEHWGPHLGKMKDFWSALTFYNARYKGKPVPAHQAVPGIRPEHFDPWLAIWRATLEDLAPNAQVVDFFLFRARGMAKSLRKAVSPPGADLQPGTEPIPLTAIISRRD